jgi:hypothetical protein
MTAGVYPDSSDHPTTLELVVEMVEIESRI